MAGVDVGVCVCVCVWGGGGGECLGGRCSRGGSRVCLDKLELAHGDLQQEEHLIPTRREFKAFHLFSVCHCHAGGVRGPTEVELRFMPDLSVYVWIRSLPWMAICWPLPTCTATSAALSEVRGQGCMFWARVGGRE